LEGAFHSEIEPILSGSLNWLGQKIFVRGHVEDQYYEQTKRLQLSDSINTLTGVQETYYVKDVPRLIYSIPFSKTNVDKIINNKHPFGSDSISITGIASVVFYGKFENKGDTIGFRCAGYTYDQFANTSWQSFEALARRKGGPTGKARSSDEQEQEKPGIK